MTWSLTQRTGTIHLQMQGELYCRLQQAYLTVRPTKCSFDSKSGEVLYHLAGSDYSIINNENLEKDSPSQTTHYEERNLIGSGTCKLLFRLLIIICGKRGIVEWSEKERITGALTMGGSSGENFCASTSESVEIAITWSHKVVYSTHQTVHWLPHWCKSKRESTVPWHLLHSAIISFWRKSANSHRVE